METPEPRPLSLPTEVGAVIAGRALERVGADAAYVATPRGDGEPLEVARVTPFAERPVALDVPADAPYPIAEAVRTRRPLFIASNDDLCQHPGLVRISSEDHACATLPLVDDDGTLVGAVNFGFDDPHEFSAEERALIEVVAAELAHAMASARRVDSEIVRRTPPVGAGSR